MDWKESFRRVLLGTLFAGTMVFAESSIGLDINNDDVELLGAVDLNRYIGYSDSTHYLIEANYLHADDNLLAVGIIGQNRLQGAPNLTLGLGIKTVFTDDFAALPFTARAIFRLPFGPAVPPTSLRGSFAYAPSVLSFGDADSYKAWRVEADMEVIHAIHIFAGYRDIDTNYETYDRNFNDSFYAGMKLNF